MPSSKDSPVAPSQPARAASADVPAQRRADPQGRSMWRLVELEASTSRTFDDPSLEWRRLFSEVLGTFFLVLVGAGGGVVNAATNGAIGRAPSVTAPGLVVLGVILYLGAVSGAHLNPAVTLSVALRGDCPCRRLPGYILVQLLAAPEACLGLRALFGNIGQLGLTQPGSGFTDLQAMAVELLLTVGLVSVILGTASSAQNVGPLSAIAVGA